MPRIRTHLSAVLVIVAAGASAVAHPVSGTYVDGVYCDNHGALTAQEELGRQPLFPMDERINTDSWTTTETACPATDDLAIPNKMVLMINLSGREWEDLFYVADCPWTDLSNWDGEAEDADAPGLMGKAFRIDSVGANSPLFYESIAADGVLQVGESWQFIVQDYTNAFGLGAWEIDSLGFAGASFDPSSSSGSRTRSSTSASGFRIRVTGPPAT